MPHASEVCFRCERHRLCGRTDGIKVDAWSGKSHHGIDHACRPSGKGSGVAPAANRNGASEVAILRALDVRWPTSRGHIMLSSHGKLRVRVATRSASGPPYPA